jgi:hypothetical protein
MSEQDNNQDNDEMQETVANMRKEIESINRMLDLTLTKYHLLQVYLMQLWMEGIANSGYIRLETIGDILYLSKHCIEAHISEDVHAARLEHQLNAFTECVKKTSKQWGYVYLIHDAVFNLYKVGFSIDPDKRMKGISQSWHGGIRLIVKHKILTDDMKRLEKWFHDTLAEYRRDKEWFKLNDVQVEEIMSLEMAFFQLDRTSDHLKSREEVLKLARHYWLPSLKGKPTQKRLLD